MKYSDYVKDNQLEAEIDEVKNTERKATIPESVLKRFDGKSPEEIMEAYANLQQQASRQGEDMGKLRKQVDQLIELQLQSATTEPPIEEEPVKIDDLYTDTEGSISKVVEKSTKKSKERLNSIEEQINNLSRQEKIKSLDQKYEGWQQYVTSPEFAEWVQSSPYRTKLAVAANQYDFDAASDLLEMWNDHRSLEQRVEEKAKRERDLAAATLETASPPGVTVPDSYSRSDLMEKRIAAKRGNSQAKRYLAAHADSIALAYAEGRITD